MKAAKSPRWWKQDDYPIPDSFLTRDGLTIHTRDKTWRVEIDSALNWGLTTSLPAQLLYPMRAYLCHVLESNSGSSAYIVFGRLVRGVGKIDSAKLHAEVEDAIGIGLFYEFKSSLENDSEVSARTVLDSLSVFRRWYLWCNDCELPGFDDDTALELVDKVIGGSPQGLFVLQGDPDFGPLNFAEDTCLEAAISKACANIDLVPVVELQAVVAVMLSKAFGLYARHMQMLNEDDYHVELLSDASEIHWLNVPRLKKRGTRARVGTRKRRLTPRLGESIALLIARNSANTKRCASIDKVTRYRPLFVREESRYEFVGTDFHCDAYRWGKNDFLKSMHEFCLRTGLEVKLSPRRLRYSFATRLVEEGCSPLELADALDHTDLQHVMVYFNSRGRVVRQLDEAMAVRLAPFAHVFLGRLIEKRSDATRANDPASVIRFKVANGAQPDIGGCGYFKHCGLNVPLACYTCFRFEPYADAPHEAVLAALVVERRHRHEAGLDERLVQVHDATILAVADVVRRINTSAVHGARE